MQIGYEYSEFQKLSKNLRRAPDKLRIQRHEGLKVARSRLAAKVQKGFDKSKSPYGMQWAPVKRAGKPLIDTGRLRKSITSKTVNRVRDGEIRFLIGAPYGKYHQNGTQTIKKRTMLPDSRGMPDDWQAIIRNELRKTLGDALAKAVAV